jgi:hypothetical protein
MSHLVLVDLMIASSQAAKAGRYDNQSAPNGVWSDLADIQDHNGHPKAVRLHHKTAWSTQSETSCGSLAGPYRERISVEGHVGVQLVIDVAGHAQDHLLTDRDLDLFLVRVTVPSAIVMSIASVDGVADAVSAADSPLVRDVVRPLKIRQSPSTPSRNAVPARLCLNLAGIHDHNGLGHVGGFMAVTTRGQRRR